MTYFKEFKIDTNNATGDAFGRVRVSDPGSLHGSKQSFDNQPLFWDDQEVSGAGTGSTHSADRASTVLDVSGATAGERIRQTFQRFNYQEGKSQLILMTAILDKSGGGADITRELGAFDDNNGIFFKDNAGTYQVVRRSYVSGAPVDTAVNQASWNVDPMDGTGDSGITIDFTKTNIFVIDLEWLGVGRVRFGFNIDGVTYVCHEFLNANNLDAVYMSNPNLPLRWRIDNGGTGAASELEVICAAVASEGSQQNVGVTRYASTNGTQVDANTAGTIYAVVGIRLKSAYIGVKVTPLRISMVAETDDDFEWLLISNPTVDGAFAYAGETNSAVEVARGATANTVANGYILDGGFSAASGQAASIVSSYALGAAIDGTVDELVLCVRPLGGPGVVNADIQGSITWREQT